MAGTRKWCVILEIVNNTGKIIINNDNYNNNNNNSSQVIEISYRHIGITTD